MQNKLFQVLYIIRSGYFKLFFGKSCNNFFQKLSGEVFKILALG